MGLRVICERALSAKLDQQIRQRKDEGRCLPVSAIAVNER